MRTNPPAALRPAGFTLIEVMTVVAIIGILAAIATPMYADYVRRSKIVDATTALGDMRTDMEKYFMDNRTYLDGGTCHVVTSGRVAAYNGNPASHFTVAAGNCTATTYLLTMNGKAAEAMNGFTYTIDQANNKTSATAWGPSSLVCWIIKKDGSC